jgi:Nucleotidyltransferase domain
MGADVLVIGSLATGQFGADSDIDLLVTKLPRDLKYAIEGIVKDCLGDLPFDVIYLDEVPADRVEKMLAAAVPAPTLSLDHGRGDDPEIRQRRIRLLIVGLAAIANWHSILHVVTAAENYSAALDELDGMPLPLPDDTSAWSACRSSSSRATPLRLSWTCAGRHGLSHEDKRP